LLTVDEVFDTLLTICQRVQEWSAHSDSFCTEAQSFDDIGAASNTAVNENFKVLEHFWVMLPDLEKS
jgi:hypothetical protein